MWNCWDIVKFFIALANFQIAPIITTPHQIPVSLLNKSAVKSYTTSSIFFQHFIQSTFLEVTGPVIPELIIQTNSNYERVLQSIGMRGSGHVVGGILGRWRFNHMVAWSELHQHHQSLPFPQFLLKKHETPELNYECVFGHLGQNKYNCYKIEQDYTMWSYSKLE